MQKNKTVNIFSLKESFPLNNINLSIVNFGIQENDPTHRQGPVTKAEHVLQYITEGQGELIIKGKRYTVKEGDMFYLPKNVVLHYFSDKSNPYRYYWVGFDGTSARQLLALAGFSEETPVIRIERENILPIYKAIHAALCSRNIIGYVNANAALLNLFSAILSIRDGNLKTIKNVSVEYVSNAISFIQNNFSYDINVTAIADAVGLKRNYFCVLFKKHTGVSPVEYLMNYRINQARFMLAQGMHVTETAISCGFNSPSNFSAQFKRIIGQTPFEYRKNTFEKANED